MAVEEGATLGRRQGWRQRFELLERTAWAAAVVLGGTWVTARVLAWSEKQRSLAAFHQLTYPALASAPPSPPTESARAMPGASLPRVDQRLWAPERIQAYTRALLRPAPPPLAVLRIPRFGLVVPVLEGTDEWTLDRAVGHIEGTPAPGREGNVGLAGHRDGYFRVLKDIAPGDVLELALAAEVQRFRVARLLIVAPEDVSVLATSDGARLTLVTCYPFYFVGSAPRRFIVEATRE